jgi:type II secretory pathway pseudopilin PulG
MSIYVTQIEKHRFVCGLFWQSLSRPRELKKEAGDLAKKIDFDLMVLRKDHTTAQAGFAQSKEGVKRTMFSLAAAVSKAVTLEGAYYDGRQQPVHNWLGAFKLPDGKWAYFAVRDANFLPNGDFAGTKEEVLERLHGDYGLGGWNAVIGDAELQDYGFHNFNAKRIEDLLPHTRSGRIKVYGWWALRPVKPRASTRVLAVSGVVLAALAIGGAYYWQHYQKMKEEAERERAIEAARRQMMRDGAAAALQHPWADKPAPLLTAQACLEQFTHIAAGGWKLDEYVCTPQQASYSWSRENSTIGFLRAQVPDALIELNGDKASYSQRMALGLGRDDRLLEQKELIEPVISRLQAVRISPRLTRVEPPAPPSAQPAIPGMPRNEPPKPDWKSFNFTLDAGGVSPVDIARILSRPGIRIEKLIYRAGAWSIEGVMYVN